MQKELVVEKEVSCHHCGDVCVAEHIRYDEKDFCCQGCRAVYELFMDTGLQEIYADASKLKPEDADRYAYLENEEIANSLLDFKSENHNTIRVTLPAIHCSSCVYLLENLRLFSKGIIRVNVNFVKQEADIHYNPSQLSLKDLAALLHRIGYKPQFKTERKKKARNSLSLKIGVAAFCFGNVMLLSFPEYFGFEEQIDSGFRKFFSYLNLILSLPVLLYSGVDYFKSAYRGLRNKFINIDVPIALGIVTLFGRSAYEVLTQTGAGYLDSLTGLVFFLLIGKWFQSKTYENLSFERDYKSYFPLAVTKITDAGSVAVPIAQLKEGDRVIIRNQEIIPADGVLTSDTANIDYSFVTGEEKPIRIETGSQVYAGGRQVGKNIELQITKPSSQSYLTSLWNNHAFKKEENDTEILINKISKSFTIIIISIATLAAIYWSFANSNQMWQVFTAVLIVACPCALALSAPFTNGNLLRVFGRNKLYLKNATSVEKLNSIDTIVFDKTGTLTETSAMQVVFKGGDLSSQEKQWVKKLVENSMHPISQQIKKVLPAAKNIVLSSFEEIPGNGLVGDIQGVEMKLGRAPFVSKNIEEIPGRVYLSIGDELKGYFEVSNIYRQGLEQLIEELDGYQLAVLSGDNDQERGRLEQIFPKGTEMHFRQQPEDKLNFIKSLQAKGAKVMMLGDGLNDAGALKQSDVGIAVTEDVSTFSPACDGILEGKELSKLATFLKYAKDGRSIMISSFGLSFLYNIVGISFAVAGALTPIFAAVLMPISSITVVAFTTLAGNYFANKKQLL